MGHDSKQGGLIAGEGEGLSPSFICCVQTTVGLNTATMLWKTDLFTLDLFDQNVDGMSVCQYQWLLFFEYINFFTRIIVLLFTQSCHHHLFMISK